MCCPVFKYPIDVAKGLWKKQFVFIHSFWVTELELKAKLRAVTNSKDKSLNTETGSKSSKDSKEVNLTKEEGIFKGNVGIVDTSPLAFIFYLSTE